MEQEAGRRARRDRVVPAGQPGVRFVAGLMAILLADCAPGAALTDSRPRACPSRARPPSGTSW
ncbi:hypothetical protein ABZ848_15920 [Streptomyces sp. NPDC047081]|uniref:hypothetical protein n=1 Tax=Streptomyces sp. NPDC047081 TaxID=3154706 RepID=UPI0033F9283C